MASVEYQGWPPRVVRGSAAHASSVNHTVKLPRWRRLASYSRQLATLCRCRGMWWRRSWFSLNGTVASRIRGGAALLRHPAPLSTNRPIRAPRSQAAASGKCGVTSQSGGRRTCHHLPARPTLTHSCVALRLEAVIDPSNLVLLCHERG